MTRVWSASVLACWLIACGGGRASPGATGPAELLSAGPPPLDGTPELVQPIPDVEIRRLANGLTVFLVSRPRLPYARIVYVDRGGANDVRSDHPGLATVAGDLLLRGTTLPGDNALVNVRLDGVPLDVTTSTTATQVSISAFNTSVSKAIALLAATLRRPVFPKSQLDAAKRITNESYLEGAGHSAVLRLLMEELFDAPDAYGYLAPGTCREVESATVARIQRFYGEHFGPAHAALILVGDVSWDEVESDIVEQFSDWKSSPAAKLPVPLPAPELRSAEGVRILVIPAERKMMSVGFVHPAPGYASDDAHVFGLLEWILVEAPRSRTQESLRHRTGHSYGISAEPLLNRDGGVNFARAEVRAEALGESITAILAEMREIQRELVTDEELVAARNHLLTQWNEILQSNEALASLLAIAFAEDWEFDVLTEYEKRLRAVTREEIRRLARELLPHTVFFASGPEEATLRQLEPIGTARVVTPETGLCYR